MITEVALLHIRKNESDAFEQAFYCAQNIISSMQGYITHELLKCSGQADKYLLLVRWQTAEDHLEGFRKHIKYKEWKELLHHFYDPLPSVEHYKKIKSFNKKFGRYSL